MLKTKTKVKNLGSNHRGVGEEYHLHKIKTRAMADFLSAQGQATVVWMAIVLKEKTIKLGFYTK